MSSLTDEIKIISSSIIFANKHDLGYHIFDHLTKSGFKKVRIHLGERVQYNEPEMSFGADFAVDKRGNLKYNELHVFYLLGNEDYKEKTEEFRKYLQRETGFECNW